MPGAMNYRVDVQFGNWDAPAEPSFGFGVEPQSSGVTIVGNNNYNRCVHAIGPDSMTDTLEFMWSLIKLNFTPIIFIQVFFIQFSLNSQMLPILQVNPIGT